jgi:hypothetical protein
MALITLEVLRHKFDVIADEMESALLKSAYASIVTVAVSARRIDISQRVRW